jgi:hypothetical protein
VTEVTADPMIAETKRLCGLFDPVAGNLNIKIPVNPAFNLRMSLLVVAAFYTMGGLQE